MKERNELHVVLVHSFFDASDVISKHEIVLEHVIFYFSKPPSKKGTLHNWFSSKSAAPKPEPPPQAATIKEEEKEPDSKKLKLQ